MVEERGGRRWECDQQRLEWRARQGREKKNGFQIMGGKLYAPYGFRKGGGAFRVLLF